MNKIIYILGLGGMAREVFSYYNDLKQDNNIFGFIEQNCNRPEKILYGKKVLDGKILQELQKGSFLIGAIGSPLRKKWIESIDIKKFIFDTLEHSSILKGNNVTIAEGCIIAPNVILTCDITIKKHCIVNVAASISHDCILGNFVTICPGVHVGGYVDIDDGTWIGIGATIKDKVSIGKNSFIAAGAVVIDDIPDNSLALGVPAKVIKKLTLKDWEGLV